MKDNETLLKLMRGERFEAGGLKATYENIDCGGGEMNRFYCVWSYGSEIASAPIIELGAGVGQVSLDDGCLHVDAYDHDDATDRHADLVKVAWGVE
jgi:hypothetical protein